MADRLPQLKTGNTRFLRVLFTYHCRSSFQCEKSLQRFYAHKKEEREWFRLTVDDIRHLSFVFGNDLSRVTFAKQPSMRDFIVPESRKRAIASQEEKNEDYSYSVESDRSEAESRKRKRPRKVHSRMDVLVDLTNSNALQVQAHVIELCALLGVKDLFDFTTHVPGALLRQKNAQIVELCGKIQDARREQRGRGKTANGVLLSLLPKIAAVRLCVSMSTTRWCAGQRVHVRTFTLKPCGPDARVDRKDVTPSMSDHESGPKPCSDVTPAVIYQSAVLDLGAKICMMLEARSMLSAS